MQVKKADLILCEKDLKLIFVMGEALDDYITYLRLERGLSETRFRAMLMISKHLFCISMIFPSTHTENVKEDAQAYVYHLAKQVNARSQRQISGLKSF